MRAQAVIGAGYGDEGKGLITDYLAYTSDHPVVVRTNGGAQAGHTVVTPSGARHVFHHFGSGAFAGAKTHLSRFMVCNPIEFTNERQSLLFAKARVDTTVDPLAPVTTPWDMLINQIAETSRDHSRHGSCGLGVGETIERHTRSHPLTVADLHSSLDIAAMMAPIVNDWVPARLAELGLVPDERTEKLFGHLRNHAICAEFVRDCEAFIANTVMLDDFAVTGEIIMEGAQGLMLDQDYGTFPHVTRSNTGLKNMVEFAKMAGIDEIFPIYVTRCYATRHGAGPFHGECYIGDTHRVDDRTNIYNAWQRSLRFGHLNEAKLNDAIAHDVRTYGDGIVGETWLGVTCLDQVIGDHVWVQDRAYHYGTESAFLEAIRGDCATVLTSRGPTRETISRVS